MLPAVFILREARVVSEYDLDLSIDGGLTDELVEELEGCGLSMMEPAPAPDMITVRGRERDIKRYLEKYYAPGEDPNFFFNDARPVGKFSFEDMPEL